MPSPRPKASGKKRVVYHSAAPDQDSVALCGATNKSGKAVSHVVVSAKHKSGSEILERADNNGDICPMCKRILTAYNIGIQRGFNFAMDSVKQQMATLIGLPPADDGPMPSRTSH